MLRRTIVALAMTLAAALLVDGSAGATSYAASDPVPRWHVKICNLKAGKSFGRRSYPLIAQGRTTVVPAKRGAASLQVITFAYGIDGTDRRCDLVIAAMPARSSVKSFGEFRILAVHPDHEWWRSDGKNVMYIDETGFHPPWWSGGSRLFSPTSTDFGTLSEVVPPRRAVLAAEVYRPSVATFDPATGIREEHRVGETPWNLTIEAEGRGTRSAGGWVAPHVDMTPPSWYGCWVATKYGPKRCGDDVVPPTTTPTPTPTPDPASASVRP